MGRTELRGYLRVVRSHQANSCVITATIRGVSVRRISSLGTLVAIRTICLRRGVTARARNVERIIMPRSSLRRMLG